MCTDDLQVAELLGGDVHQQVVHLGVLPAQTPRVIATFSSPSAPPLCSEAAWVGLPVHSSNLQILVDEHDTPTGCWEQMCPAGNQRA